MEQQELRACVSAVYKRIVILPIGTVDETLGSSFLTKSTDDGLDNVQSLALQY